MQADGGTDVFSREDVVRYFELEGMTVTAWAQEHCFRPANVYAVLDGRTKGRRGESHRIAIALRLKPPSRKPSKVAE